MPTVTLRPTGDGALLQCFIYPASPTTHYDKVDEVIPNNGTDYVRANNSIGETDRDTYTKPSSLIPALSTINGLVISTRDWTPRTDATYGSTRSILRSGSTNAYGATKQSASWTTQTDFFSTSPFTGLSWTIAEIDGLQIGVECKSTDTTVETVAPAYCSTVWIVVTYTEAVLGGGQVINEGLSCVRFVRPTTINNSNNKPPPRFPMEPKAGPFITTRYVLRG
jgi:hypothetical protein